MSKEAGEARTPMSLETAHAKMLDIRKNFPERQGYLVNGFTVHNMGDKGLRVRMPGKTVIYKDPREAAVAVFRKQHHEEGHAPIPLPGGAPEPPRAPSGRPHLITGAELTPYTNVKSAKMVMYQGDYAGSVRALPSGKFQGWHGGKPVGEFDSPEEAANSVVSQFISVKRGSPLPGPEPPRYPGGITPPPRTIREIPGTRGTQPRVIQPQSLDVRVRGFGPEQNKKMREQVLKATTHQGQVTPELVKKTQITVTKSPHGKSKGRTLASHTGQQNTLHIKPHVLVGDYAQNTLESNRGSWWVPTDTQHDLSMNVMTHEFGHGVHGELVRQGVIEVTRHSQYARNPQEQLFWRGLASAIGTKWPETIRDGQLMDVGSWHASNRLVIKKAVGEYASSNINEMFAELWTEYRLSSNPRPPAKYFGDYVTRKLINP